ncbi:hypothetical protein A2U01_0068041, partial [Trifolium medium]|nr:hypothetical protein [Trifolium medium]
MLLCESLDTSKEIPDKESSWTVIVICNYMDGATLTGSLVPLLV